MSSRPCPKCGSQKRVAGQGDVFRGEISGVVADVESPKLVCAKCGTVCDRAMPEQESLAFARFLFEVGNATGEAFRSMRLALELKGAELANLLGVRKETISRWETGRTPVDRSAWVVLGSMVQDVMECRTRTEDRLHGVMNPRIPRKPVKLVVALDSGFRYPDGTFSWEAKRGLKVPSVAVRAGPAERRARRRAAAARSRRRSSRSSRA